jgi:hypothetical protein
MVNKLRHINFCWARRLSKNKSIELQFCTEKGFSDWFGFKLYTKSKCDHAGLYFEFEFLTILYFHIWIYDNRHWNYEIDEYETYYN